MPNEQHLQVLERGVDAWNRWRRQTKSDIPDLTGAHLSRVDLEGIDLSGANLTAANLSATKLVKADLTRSILNRALLMRAALHGSTLQYALCEKANFANAILKGASLDHADFAGAKLTGADLRFAKANNVNFSKADLTAARLVGVESDRADLRNAKLRNVDLSKSFLIRANLRGSNLSGANLRQADLTGGNLSDANLRNASLVETIITNANFRHCRIYGISAWDLIGQSACENDLVINLSGKPHIQVDNIDVAQFIYLLIENAKLRGIIDTITSRVVLILGRFTSERKPVLDSLREALREYGFLPVMFDFDRPESKDFSETIRTLAGLSLFVVADITNPKSSPLELQATVPDYQIPFVPIIQVGESPFSMFSDLQSKYDWVLQVVAYESTEDLLSMLEPAIIDRALKKHSELQEMKSRVRKMLTSSDFQKSKRL